MKQAIDKTFVNLVSERITWFVFALKGIRVLFAKCRKRYAYRKQIWIFACGIRKLHAMQRRSCFAIYGTAPRHP
jgi:hypothetical protein